MEILENIVGKTSFLEVYFKLQDIDNIDKVTGELFLPYDTVTKKFIENGVLVFTKRNFLPYDTVTRKFREKQRASFH